MAISTNAKLIITSLAIGLGATAAFADGNRMGERGGHMPISFDMLDTDGNGQLTLEEVQTAPQARFAQADTNGDGQLDKDELIARAQADIADRVAKMIEKRDENGDGVLSAEELAPKRAGKGAERMFKRVDANDDGVVTQEEFDTAMQKRGERGGPRGMKGHGGHGDRG
jgi:Ca2+-binding EF-hand superfamily protein